MEIVGPSLTPFVDTTQTDSAYPSRIGEPSVDGPVIYPEQQPNDPQNITDFQRETGLDPSKLPNVGPRLRLLTGGKQESAVPAAPTGRIANSTTPMTMAQFAAAPEAGSAFPWMSWQSLLLVGAAAAVGYLVARSGNSDSGPLIADLGDEE